MLVGRLTGGFDAGFIVVNYPEGAHVPVVDRLTQFDPLKFLSSPGLWIGLVVAAAFHRRSSPPAPLSRTALIHCLKIFFKVGRDGTRPSTKTK